MSTTLRSLVFGASMVLSYSAFAADFSAADALFAQRGDSLAAATTAKEAYRSLLPGLASDQEKIYAVTQMSRLDMYVGGMLAGVDQDVRNARLDECISNVDQIAHTKSQQYYYYYLACIAIRGKQAGVLQRLKYGLMMRNIQDAALASTKNAEGQLQGGFDGGGILRVISAVRANAKAKPLGLFNAQEAVEFASLALDTAKQEVRPFGEMSGRDYFENYNYLASAQVSLGIETDDLAKVKEGQNTVAVALQKISDMRDFGELPPGRDPETNYYENELKMLGAAIDFCLPESDWKGCLANRMN